jgi:type IV pilus assembly protein PilQ
MRKQLLTVFLPLLVFSLSAAAEMRSADTATTKRAALQKVDVVRGDNGISIALTENGGITPSVTMLENPARIVIDLPGTVLATSRNHINVNRDGIKSVRIGGDGHEPPTSRVVVDLEQPCTYEFVPGSIGQIVLKLHMAEDRSKVKVPATSVVGAGQNSEASGKNESAAPVSKNESNSKAAETSVNNFVFVEPSYKPKQESAEQSKLAVVDPSARAVVAAAKFVEKPDTDLLLPAPKAAMQAQAPQSPQPAVNLAAEQKSKQQQQPSVNGAKYTGEPISVNLKDVDLKDFFRLVHEISGLNVVLDPNVKGSLTIVLDDVPWDQALDIVLKNNNLARQLEGNVLRIATVDTLRKEAEDRRAQQEAEALAVEKVTVTRFLSYAHSKDVVPTLKKFLTQRGDVISDDRTNAVIISDIPNVIPGVDRLLNQLDRKTQEVEIEARVVAATRSFARDIGTQLGFGWGNGHSAAGGDQSLGSTPTSVGSGLVPTPLYPIVSGSGASSGSQIPLFSNLGSASPTSGLQFLNFSNNMRIDFLLTMAESRGLLKILSRPRVVTQNNIQALVKQGVRVPIVTQAQLGGPPTVTYVDAFLRLTVIPQITSEGTIFLNVDVENTTPDFGHAIQGNPTLITQQATTQVLVTDGGTVVIGGVIQTQNSISVNQVPLLGNIPYLGNLFKHTQVSTSNQELIFFITPRIIQT